MQHFSPAEDPCGRQAANFSQLSPITFIQRTADVYPDVTSVVSNGVSGERRTTWGESYRRTRRLSSALRSEFGIQPGNCVACMLYNSVESFEMHWAIPMAGAIVNMLNTRIDAKQVCVRASV
jgi:fatty-acyl-CoA synthase